MIYELETTDELFGVELPITIEYSYTPAEPALEASFSREPIDCAPGWDEEITIHDLKIGKAGMEAHLILEEVYDRMEYLVRDHIKENGL